MSVDSVQGSQSSYHLYVSYICPGFRLQPTPIALLQRWYLHVREKRQTPRYMAENFATFDYKTQEEVFTVIKSLTSVLSTTGMQLLEIISPSHLLTTLHGTSWPEAAAPVETTTDRGLQPLLWVLKLNILHRSLPWTLSLWKVCRRYLP